MLPCPSASSPSMEKFQLFSVSTILFAFHFSCLFLSSTSYVFPDHYFINCGSASTLSVDGRNFTADDKLVSGDSRPVEDLTLTADKLYQTARIFEKSTTYKLDLDLSGTYVVRFQFYPFPSLGNLSDARFDVSAARVSLLPNFTVENSNYPLIQEFLLQIPREGEYEIEFKPHENSFGFVNAIEVFVAPPDLIPNSAPSVTGEGSKKDYDGILNGLLHSIHRINVGGENITPKNDTAMFRYWIPDDEYLFFNGSAKNIEVDRVNYQSGGATQFDAPDAVYRTAKAMNTTDNDALNNFNISWRFPVRKGVEHLVRLHFCDIVSRTSNEMFRFNLYIYSNFLQEMYPYGDITLNALAAPYYRDFVVYSDDSGFLSISVGPRSDSRLKTALLNGVEVMELIKGRGLVASGGSESSTKSLLIIVGSSVGGVILVLVILIAVFVGLRKRKRKWKPGEAFDWTLAHPNGGSSDSRTTVRSSTGFHFADLNLGLKLNFSEILYATEHFDSRLMIGAGGFGKVYRGMLRNGTKVAVKRSEPGHGQGLPEFHTEILVLSKIRHNHLVSLIGYCDERNEMILVYEFMENGTLREHLYNMHGEADDRRDRLSWEQRLQICIGAAKGLYYLHTGGSTGTIIHRDIKSTNILLDENFVAKVADFGLSRSGQLDQTHVSTDVKGSFGYMDPEYFRCFQLTQKSDVYSFGVVLLEVLCARPVIDHSLPREELSLSDWGMSRHRQGELDKIIDPFLEGKINPNSLRKFGETVEKCLQDEGVHRPNMVDVLWDLEYCLQLQQSAIPGQPYEDSTTQVSWSVPMPAIQRLPSNSAGFGEEEVALNSNTVYDETQVFSLLNLDEAR